ncbi:hypothetical protein ACN47E_005009 [Coniothyrium glycines]
MEDIQRLKKDYPWIQTPLVVGAPMRLIALADMAVEISKAGGIGFIGAGTDVSNLSTQLQNAQRLLSATQLPTAPGLPIGIGFINWGAELSVAMPLVAQYKPAAVWFFAPASLASLREWTAQARAASPATKVWVQVGSVAQALATVAAAAPDVLVVQGTDAGGHGLAQGAGLIALLPEVVDALRCRSRAATPARGETHSPVVLAAGGLADARSLLATLCLGAAGIVLGTRLLASPEANISQGYKDEILRACDGGQSTARTKVYDRLRGTNWAESHNARGLINRSFVDAQGGMPWEENTRLYREEEGKGDQGWGVEGRMTTYAGSAVGLVKQIQPVGDIVREVREGVGAVMGKLPQLLQ